MTRQEAEEAVLKAWERVLHLSLNGAPRTETDHALKNATAQEEAFNRRFGNEA